jgi:DNA mismatch endonuclease (patch repair protein)
MQANRGRDTSPELLVRRLLHARGLRYRVHYRPAGMKRRSIDVAFTRQRLAVFVDGCFWHQCPEHFVAPKSHSTFWDQKIKSNCARDRETTALLERSGWAVLRFWEHDAPENVADSIIASLSALDAS